MSAGAVGRALAMALRGIGRASARGGKAAFARSMRFRSTTVRIEQKRDDSKLRRLAAHLDKALKHPFALQVGIFNNEQLAKIAAVHEFGSKHVPRRPLFSGFGQNGDTKTLFRRTGEVFFSKQLSLPDAIRVTQMGQKAVGVVQQRITRGIPPALALKTTKAKRAMGAARPETPLRRFDAMYNAIDWRIRLRKATT